MFCARCGATNPGSGQFCAACGASLQTQTGVPPITSAGGSPPLGDLAAPYARPAQTSGKAIASVICGICFWIFPAAVAAIILGHLSLSEIKGSLGRLKGRGMAITGLVLGYGGVLFIPFILIIAAIAIPNLIRARMAANESWAAASLRTIAAAAFMYNTQYSNGFPPSLDALDGAETGTASCDHARLIGSAIATGHKYGYVFTYTPTATGDTENPPLADQAKANGCTIAGAQAFTVTAEPVRRGTTGMKGFFVDQTAVIRVESNGTATADSPVLGGGPTF